MPTNHISIATLFERVRLKTELDSAAQSHLEACTFCRNQLSWMEVAAGLGPKQLAYEPPESLMAKVLQIGRNTSRLKQLRNVIVALPKWDSFSEPAPVGIRHGEPSSRQIIFEANDLEIGIWLRPSQGQSLTLLGQILDKSSGPIQDPSAYVDLIAEGDHIKASPLSQWGEFVFTEVPKTPYGLQFYFHDRIVQIPSMPLIRE